MRFRMSPTHGAARGSRRGDRRKRPEAQALSGKVKGEILHALYRVLSPRNLQKQPTLFLLTALDSEYELPYYISYTSEQIAEKTGQPSLPEEYAADRKPFVTFCFGVGSHVARWKPDGGYPR